jgi:glycosyltransferase involved in cell wall biosynthesis
MSPGESGRRLRIAHWSPLPPQRSGIADYCAELLPRLAEHVDIELITEDGERAGGALSGYRTHPPDRLPALLAPDSAGSAESSESSEHCDAVVYHLGNNREFHTAIYRSLLEIPGIVVLHDVVVHHLVRDLTLYSGDLEGYVREMRYAYGGTGEIQARRSIASGVPLDPWSFPLFERIVDRSLAVLVHNRFTADRVRASRPATRLAVVPHHLSLAELPHVAEAGPGAAPEARAALGLEADELVIATFGFFTAAKRIDVLIRAFARLRQRVPKARLLLVGEISPHYDFERVFRPELRPGVTLCGRLDLREFLLAMQATDIAVNLRFPTSGETSGTLIRLLGLGKPVVVSRAGAFAEIPDGCCAKIDVDDTEEELLLATLERLATDARLREEMGENARRHVASHHTLEASARGYADLVEAAAGTTVFRAAPPLLAFPEADLLSGLAAAASAELVDLGLGADLETPGENGDILGALATAIIELGLDRPDEEARS